MVKGQSRNLASVNNQNENSSMVKILTVVVDLQDVYFYGSRYPLTCFVLDCMYMYMYG